MSQDFSTWIQNEGDGQILANKNRIRMTGGPTPYSTNAQSPFFALGANEVHKFLVRFRVPGEILFGIYNPTGNNSAKVYQNKPLNGNADEGLTFMRVNNQNIYDHQTNVTDRRLYSVIFLANDDGKVETYFDGDLWHTTDEVYVGEQVQFYLQSALNGNDVVIRNG